MFAYRNGDDGCSDLVGRERLIEADAVLYLHCRVILTGDDKTGRSLRCNLFFG